MVCFLIPTADAIVMTVVTKAVKAKEAKLPVSISTCLEKLEAETKFSFSRKLKWLTNLLWGGAVLLAFEHVWRGEVVPWFPFLTAASDPTDAKVMLYEMGTVGVSMAVLVTVIWVGMVLASNAIEKRALKMDAVQK